jgi:hypothetical protein
MTQSVLKYCSGCEKELTTEEFGVDKQRHDSLTSRCRSCRNKYSKKWERENPDSVAVKNKRARERERKKYLTPEGRRIHKDRELRSTFGISLAEYETMLKNQNHGCAICSRQTAGHRTIYFAVDHNHKTGKVRGLLCSSCNRGIGHFFENINFMSSAIDYLRSHNENTAN